MNQYTKSQLDEAVRAAVEAEREECAKVASQMDADHFRGRYKAVYNRKRYDVFQLERQVNKALTILSEDISAAIRARGETK